MTRRELTDPFGSDDEEETVEPLKDNKSVSEPNGAVINGSNPPSEKTEDLFADLPKPNIVSNFCVIRVFSFVSIE